MPRVAIDRPATRREASTTLAAVRVRFGETDLMGIAHHATYLFWLEVGRVAYLKRRGIDATSWEARGLHLPVVEATVTYASPARFDERVVVATSIGELRRASLRFDYRLTRQTADGALVATGSTRLACVDARLVPTRIPRDVAVALAGDELAPAPFDAV